MESQQIFPTKADELLFSLDKKKEPTEPFGLFPDEEPIQTMVDGVNDRVIQESTWLHGGVIVEVETLYPRSMTMQSRLTNHPHQSVMKSVKKTSFEVTVKIARRAQEGMGIRYMHVIGPCYFDLRTLPPFHTEEEEEYQEILLFCSILLTDRRLFELGPSACVSDNIICRVKEWFYDTETQDLNIILWVEQEKERICHVSNKL